MTQTIFVGILGFSGEDWLLGFIIFGIFIFILSTIRITKGTSTPAHQILAVEDFTCSSEQFYDRFTEKIEALILPDVKTPKIVLKSDGNVFFFSGRKYLMISRREVTCYICAAPYASSYFFSMWTIERIPLSRFLLGKIPVFGPSFEKSFSRMTFYKADTMAMFHHHVNDIFKQSMNETIDSRITREVSKEDLRASFN